MAYMFRLEPTCHVSNRGWAHCFLFLIFFYTFFFVGSGGVGGVGNGYFLVRHVLPSHFYSLQSFKKHELHDVLEDPGNADVTANVDFAYLRKATHGKGWWKLQTFDCILKVQRISTVDILLKKYVVVSQSLPRRNSLIMHIERRFFQNSRGV